MKADKAQYSVNFSTPLGELFISCNDTHLLRVGYYQAVDFSATHSSHPIIDLTIKQLNQYFNGKRSSFNLPLNPAHGTAFQQRVWRELTNIPFGETSSYSAIATTIGNPNAQRAVGQANNKNPFSILIPCHRVVGSNGSLTGYAGGLQKKQWLLEFEALVLQ